VSTLVLFDGDCSLCNGQARFITKRDRTNRLDVRPRYEVWDQVPETWKVKDVILVRTSEGRWFGASAAIVRVLWRLGPHWKLLGGLLWLVPLPLRDAVYHQVAARRHRGAN